jgi:hypothetical protein
MVTGKLRLFSPPIPSRATELWVFLMVIVTVLSAVVLNATAAQSQCPSLRLTMPTLVVMTAPSMAHGKRESTPESIETMTSFKL